MTPLFAALHMSATGTNRRSFGISLMPAMGGSCGHCGRGLDRARPPPLTQQEVECALQLHAGRTGPERSNGMPVLVQRVRGETLRVSYSRTFR